MTVIPPALHVAQRDLGDDLSDPGVPEVPDRSSAVTARPGGSGTDRINRRNGVPLLGTDNAR